MGEPKLPIDIQVNGLRRNDDDQGTNAGIGKEVQILIFTGFVPAVLNLTSFRRYAANKPNS
jgi:hypothetical protein